MMAQQPPPPPHNAAAAWGLLFLVCLDRLVVVVVLAPLLVYSGVRCAARARSCRATRRRRHYRLQPPPAVTVDLSSSPRFPGTSTTNERTVLTLKGAASALCIAESLLLS